MMSDYGLAWVFYIAAGCALLAVLWRLLCWFKLKDSRQLVMALAVVFLFTPVAVGTDGSFWAPAFMAAGIDLITVDAAAALNRLWPMLIVMFLVVLGLLAFKVYKNKSQL